MGKICGNSGSDFPETDQGPTDFCRLPFSRRENGADDKSVEAGKIHREVSTLDYLVVHPTKVKYPW